MARRGHGEGSIYDRKNGRWAASITLESVSARPFIESETDVFYQANKYC